MWQLALGLLGKVKPKQWLFIGLAVAVGLLVVFGKMYYTTTQNKIESLTAEIVQAEQRIQIQQEAIVTQQETIDQIQADKKQADAVIIDLNQDLAAAREVVADTQRKFNKVSKVLGERDIARLGYAKPKLITKIITNGTNDVNRCYEIISGAELTEDEVNAERISESNTACPELANPNVVR